MYFEEKFNRRDWELKMVRYAFANAPYFLLEFFGKIISPLIYNQRVDIYAIRMSKPLDTNLSIEIGKAIKSKPNDFFNNAYKAALANKKSMYVQGFLVFPGYPYKPLEYGWIELDDSIVDPSLAHLDKKPEELYYFPAHRLPVKKLEAQVEEAKEDYPEDEPLPVYGDMPYEYYGDVMLGGTDYKVAFDEALAKSRELNKPNQN